jgi:hypothetical protein
MSNYNLAFFVISIVFYSIASDRFFDSIGLIDDNILIILVRNLFSIVLSFIINKLFVL